jgi:hypothetical protein
MHQHSEIQHAHTVKRFLQRMLMSLYYIMSRMAPPSELQFFMERLQHIGTRNMLQPSVQERVA